MFALKRRAAVDPLVRFVFLGQRTPCRAIATDGSFQPPSSNQLPASKKRPFKVPDPTPEERAALFSSLTRIIKDRRFDVKLQEHDVKEYNTCLQRLRAGIMQGDLVVVTNTLRELKEKKQVGLISARDWRELAFFVDDAQRKTSNPTPDDPAWEELAIEAVAAHGGTGDAAFALTRILQKKLQCNDHRGALDLYNRFIAEARTVLADMEHTQRNRKRVFTEPEDEPQDHDISGEVSLEASSDLLNRHDEVADANIEPPKQPNARVPYLQHSPGVFDLHLCALAAYFSLSDFSGALEVMDSVQCRFDATAISNFCELLFGDYERTQAFTRFVDNIRLARTIARPNALARDIARFAEAHDARGVLNLYQSVLETCRGGPAWASRPDDQSLQLLEPVWAAFLKAFGTMRLLPKIQDTWKEMRNQGVPVTQVLWNVYLLALSMCNQTKSAMTVWREMVSLGMLDVISYSTMLKAYINYGLVDHAIQLFGHLVKIHWRPPNQTTSVSDPTKRQIFNIVIDGLLRKAGSDTDRAAEYHHEAESLVVQMEQHGPSPDIFTHNSFLLYHAEKGDIAGAAARLRLISKSGIKPDPASFTIILQGMLKAQNPNAVKTTLDLMHAFDVAPTATVYGTVLSAIMGKDDVHCIENGFKLLDAMELSGTPPTERTYSIFLAGLFRQGGLSEEVKPQYEQELRDRLAKRQVNLTQLSYNHILAACLEPAAQPTTYMINSGLRYYNEMIRRGSLPNNKAWFLVLHTVWIVRQDANAALSVIDTMRKLGVKGDVGVQEMIQKITKGVRSRGFGPKFGTPR